MNNKLCIPFKSAELLLPKDIKQSWAVIACDQHTSEPDYWQKAANIVGIMPSTLKLILPEVYLPSDKNLSDDRNITGDMMMIINDFMQQYLADSIFKSYPDSMVYVERTLPDGKVRRGIVGVLDLEAYDFTVGSKTLIRATEGTVLDRLPPRVKVREGAALETSHVMTLIDDPLKTVIEPLAAENLPVLYDFELMLGGGHIIGKLIDAENAEKITQALYALADENNDDNLLFAIGDGNHSVAAAKLLYERDKNPANRYAMTELINIYDESLEFEPIYRVVSRVDTADLINALTAHFGDGNGKDIEYITNNGKGNVKTPLPTDLPVAEVQDFLDSYILNHPSANVDYIHGTDTVVNLCGRDYTIGFIYDGLEKSSLFPYVKENGVLPRKTFSMGSAATKRYYIECRKINS
jgi:uncharacterized protein (DUF1015 family)